MAIKDKSYDRDPRHAHIYVKGCGHTICSLGNSQHASMPKRKMYPVGDDSIPCRSCFEQARMFHLKPHYGIPR